MRYSVKFMLGFSLLSQLFFACKKADESPSPAINIFAKDCTISEAARKKAMHQAGYISLYEIYKSRSRDTANINIPAEKLDSYTNILGLIYDRKDIPQVDTISTIFHSLGWARTYIEVSVDENTPWVQQWVEGRTITSNEQLNKLIIAHQLRITQMSKTYIYVEGAKPLNGPALAKKFKSIAGVRGVLDYYRTGSIGEIAIKIDGDVAIVSFAELGGYCITDPCHDRYDFRVDSNCNVQFIGKVKI
jgi:hypothetical protein